MDHSIHFSHLLVVIGYVVIGVQFLLEVRRVKHNWRQKASLIFLVGIFILCGVTRVFMDIGLTSVFVEGLHWVLVVFTWAYVLTGQTSVIVHGFNDAVAKMVEEVDKV